MNPPSPPPTPAALTPLAWDTAHFGWPVARIEANVSDAAVPRALLRQARRDGFRLVYWAATAEHFVTAEVLAEFGGLLVDRKATFVTDDLRPNRGVTSEATGFAINNVIGTAATPALLELAVAAGEHSRFRLDPGIPADRFRDLYHLWMKRSLDGGKGVAVLVATSADHAKPVGVVTVSVDSGLGSIGLIAVDPSARGRGLGRALVEAAHRSMSAAGATRAMVVTQRENTPACSLYERLGYHLDDVSNFYHFWL